MSPKLAKQRYCKILFLSMAGYVLSILAVTLLTKFMDVPFFLNVGLAIIPALFILWLIWGHGRWIFETDEYERFRQMRGVLIGVGGTLAFTSVWGLMEMLVDAPKFPAFYVLVVFCAAYSFGTCFGHLFTRKAVVMNDQDVI